IPKSMPRRLGQPASVPERLARKVAAKAVGRIHGLCAARRDAQASTIRRAPIILSAARTLSLGPHSGPSDHVRAFYFVAARAWECAAAHSHALAATVLNTGWLLAGNRKAPCCRASRACLP